jgi:GNAT superfamily N-acetyltransferase
MELRIHTMENSWDEALWRQAEPIYDRAFPRQGRKTERNLRHVVRQGIGRVHVAFAGSAPAASAEGGPVATAGGEPAAMIGGETVAMAVTGTLEGGKGLLIDYLAVSEERRGQGIGKAFVDAFKQRAVELWGCEYMLIEIEAEETPENCSRLRFWQRCGFRATDYVHRYIWVPELYRAMVLPLRADADVSDDGEDLFRRITAFHKQAYRGGA